MSILNAKIVAKCHEEAYRFSDPDSYVPGKYEHIDSLNAIVENDFRAINVNDWITDPEHNRLLEFLHLIPMITSTILLQILEDHENVPSDAVGFYEIFYPALYSYFDLDHEGI